MSIPISGSYTLSVVQLQTISGGYYNTTNNTFVNSTTITFNGNTITYGSPLNLSITYDASSVLEKPYTAGGSYAVVVKDINTGISYYITTNPNITTGSYIQYISSTNTYKFGTATLDKAGTTSNNGINIFQNNLIVCFLAGVKISTPNGFICVEDLHIGDMILTFNDGITSKIDTVTWIGKSHAYVRQNLSDDEAGYPVRVMKNAIADGVPFKDLLITSEHCLFFEDKFVPVRMLVNGSSIIYDKTITSYDYYHIETEKHSVIRADGMLTESYLDTGNRNSFQQEGQIFSLSNNKHLKNWDTDAAACLAVCSDLVKPIYQQIEKRAKALQFPNIVKTHSITMESNICLKTNYGQIIKPLHQTSDKVMFLLPKHTQFVNILSNTSRPCDVIGPYVDDRRWLGILVGNITIITANDKYFITDHFTSLDLEGWDVIETTPCRWTNGYAELNISHNNNTNRIMIINVLAAGPYILKEEEKTSQIA